VLVRQLFAFSQGIKTNAKCLALSYETKVRISLKKSNSETEKMAMQTINVYKNRDRKPSRSGAVIPMFAIALPVIMLVSVIAINFCQMKLTRTELKIATDAAARAGARGWSESQSTAYAKSYAQYAASLNTVAGSPLTLSAAEADGQIQFGYSSQSGDGRFQFNPVTESAAVGSTMASGVRINAEKPIPLVFQVSGQTEFTPSATSVASQVDRDIALVIDRSSSMDELMLVDSEGVPYGPSRWDALIAAKTEFFNILEQSSQTEQVSVTWFATTTAEVVSLTDDLAACENAINALYPDGSTSIGDGISEAVTTLLTSAARPNALKTIIIFTDGLNNNGSEPSTAAQSIADNHPNIVVHTVTFSSEADQVAMRNVANQTGGKHRHADTSAELTQAFREMAFTFQTIITE
jgi:Flp pilus assembly protein TadG